VKTFVRIIHNEICFEWDQKKNLSNIAKHGISFEVARQVFFDPFCRLVDSTPEPWTETRQGLIGYPESGPMHLVVHLELSEQAFRIISARCATPSECRIYDGG